MRLSESLSASEEAQCPSPVLAISDQEITLHGGPPSDPALAAAFSSPVPVNGPPPAVIQVDDISDESKYDSLVAAALVAEVAQLRDVTSSLAPSLRHERSHTFICGEDRRSRPASFCPTSYPPSPRSRPGGSELRPALAWR